MKSEPSFGILSFPVIIGALGYFVDIYDLLLFGIIRRQSLTDLGVKGDALTTIGQGILSYQMAGLLIGGIIWGVMGDKKGRLSVLFGSILLYSVANIVNGLITDTTQYKIVRFIAGVGLAGELGAGITLVSELLSKEKRGLGTSMVAGIGLTGAVVAFFISQVFQWRVCYFIGGGLGLLLLLLRVSIYESSMFSEVKKQSVSKGNFFLFFTNRTRFRKYATSILIGLPTWFCIGILITFSDKFGSVMGLKRPINPGKAIMFAYCGIAVGDVLVGFISQWLKSRKKALYVFYGITVFFITVFFLQSGGTDLNMYLICAGLGFGTGFWAIFVTMAAEQFGTNLRATAATTVPNMVRGAVPLLLFIFNSFLRYNGYVMAGIYTGCIAMFIAIVAAYFTEETFGKNLNYLEPL